MNFILRLALDAIFLAIACLILALLIFVGINHGAYITGAKAFILYAGIPASMFLGIIWSFRWPSVWRHRAFALALLLAAGAQAFETWLWYEAVRDHRPADADRRTRSEVVKDLRDAGQAAYPTLTPATFAFNGARGTLKHPSGPFVPLGGVPNSMLVYCNEGGQWLVYRSDEQGFNNPPEVWRAPDTDIMAVGDSFTHGACVAQGRGFVDRIRASVPLTINLGGGGNGPLAELAAIREFGRPRRPNIVLWVYYENDLQKDMSRELTNPILRNYFYPDFSQNLAGRITNLVPAIMAASKKSLANEEAAEIRRANTEAKLNFGQGINPLTGMNWLTLGRTRAHFGLVYGGGEWPKPNIETFKKILSAALKEVDDWGGKLYFVVIPSRETVMAGQAPKYAFTVAAKNTASGLGLPIIDLEPAILNHPDIKSLFPNRADGHFSEAGHRLVGRVILEALKEQGDLPNFSPEN